MTDRPDDFSQETAPAARPGGGRGEQPTAPGFTAGRTARYESPEGHAPGYPAAYPAAPAGRPASAWPDQPPLKERRRRPPAGRPPGPPRGPGGGPGRSGLAGSGPAGARRWLRPRRIATVLAVVLCVVVIGSVASYFYFDAQLTHKNVLVDYSGRPALGAGQNWLITGSDSRQGLTRAQERRLKTGHDISGMRSDTIMILHLPANGGRPVLISLPRDSWVPIPGHGYNKINAAYSFGGPELLAETVQDVTGLYISHYMGIGFGGFVRVVNAVGGVRLCIRAPIDDKASGLHLKAGCQVLDGAEALGYVRTRHQFATQDLQRVQDQRILLRALLRKLTSAGVLANPFRAFPAASGVASTLTVDSGTSLYQLIKVAFALRNPITTTVPIANPNYVTSTGADALLWNRQEALKLFGELKADQPVSRSLITGSSQAK